MAMVNSIYERDVCFYEILVEAIFVVQQQHFEFLKPTSSLFHFRNRWSSKNRKGTMKPGKSNRPVPDMSWILCVCCFSFSLFCESIKSLNYTYCDDGV
ncbi:hypothetical protein DICVIV_03882 [Dictyocaulus viviparus]|uniref:Uncharacterized protein n=1 Tax=Dictyocaulus viviparus TaxID=29172 RepID=A0A0D8Y1T6_DICVI|nr:hypothetical protein DICVIV_03882 [Dictyocaulus viviparus]